jgi:hypothetical protein
VDDPPLMEGPTGPMERLSIYPLQRRDRTGFKAGALDAGRRQARGVRAWTARIGRSVPGHTA